MEDLIEVRGTRWEHLFLCSFALRHPLKVKYAQSRADEHLVDVLRRERFEDKNLTYVVRVGCHHLGDGWRADRTLFVVAPVEFDEEDLRKRNIVQVERPTCVLHALLKLLFPQELKLGLAEVIDHRAYAVGCFETFHFLEVEPTEYGKVLEEVLRALLPLTLEHELPDLSCRPVVDPYPRFSEKDRSDFARSDFARSDFDRSDLVRSDLKRSELAQSDFDRSDLVRSDIAQSDLVESHRNARSDLVRNERSARSDLVRSDLAQSGLVRSVPDLQRLMKLSGLPFAYTLESLPPALAEALANQLDPWFVRLVLAYGYSRRMLTATSLLLVYLKPCYREEFLKRLVDMLWEIPDDPELLLQPSVRQELYLRVMEGCTWLNLDLDLDVLSCCQLAAQYPRGLEAGLKTFRDNRTLHLFRKLTVFLTGEERPLPLSRGKMLQRLRDLYDRDLTMTRLKLFTAFGTADREIFQITGCEISSGREIFQITGCEITGDREITGVSEKCGVWNTFYNVVLGLLLGMVSFLRSAWRGSLESPPDALVFYKFPAGSLEAPGSRPEATPEATPIATPECRPEASESLIATSKGRSEVTSEGRLEDTSEDRSEATSKGKPEVNDSEGRPEASEISVASSEGRPEASEISVASSEGRPEISKAPEAAHETAEISEVSPQAAPEAAQETVEISEVSPQAAPEAAHETAEIPEVSPQAAPEAAHETVEISEVSPQTAPEAAHETAEIPEVSPQAAPEATPESSETPPDFQVPKAEAFPPLPPLWMDGKPFTKEKFLNELTMLGNRPNCLGLMFDETSWTVISARDYRGEKPWIPLYGNPSVWKGLPLCLYANNADDCLNGLKSVLTAIRDRPWSEGLLPLVKDLTLLHLLLFPATDDVRILYLENYRRQHVRSLEEQRACLLSILKTFDLSKVYTIE